MRVLLALLAALAFSGCALPAATTLESSSLPAAAPATLAQAGRLDAAHPEARFLIHVPADAAGVRFDLTWSGAQEDLTPQVTLLDLHGRDAATGGHETSGSAARGASYAGMASGVWDAPPGDYLLRVGFPFAFPQGEAFDVALHAGPLAG